MEKDQEYPPQQIITGMKPFQDVKLLELIPLSIRCSYLERIIHLRNSSGSSSR
jgi:hypothetical protein